MRKRKFSKLGRGKWNPELDAEIERGTDLTREIAKAKGHAKRHGPWQTRCPYCNELIPERDKVSHTEECFTRQTR